MTEQINVLIVGPDGLEERTVEADYRVFNQLVGGEQGSISSCPLPSRLARLHIHAYCDDNGVARELPENPYATHCGQAVLRGPIVLFRDNGRGEEVSLRPSDIELLTAYFKAPPTVEATRLTVKSRLWWDRYPSGFQIVDLGR